jgi:hypothetical protein
MVEQAWYSIVIGTGPSVDPKPRVTIHLNLVAVVSVV